MFPWQLIRSNKGSLRLRSLLPYASLSPVISGELLTRLSIWAALCAYGIGAGSVLLARHHSNLQRIARLAWTAACFFLLIHISLAFHHYHDWSHVDAYRDTARQTAEMTGLNWGGGVFLNYLLAMLWLADVVYWWITPGRHAQRPRWITVVWHGFVFFMVFNGTVVFGKGPVRWFGIALTAGLVLIWWRTRNSGIATQTSAR